ncbi:MAG TPA: aspartate--ammonia ligase [Bacteroidales bacterium]|nr:aspartate--ammonia ligase [Bacteroidales bacterium]
MPVTIQDQVSTITDLLRNEEAICYIKDNFSKKLARNLNLINVSAPIAVLDGTGINDDLNGIEKPVGFSIKGIEGQKALIVQSLAKWKRMRLKEFRIEPGKGLLTDMRAIRPDEDLDRIHSIYVDQWDWEKCILPEQRTIRYLKSTVECIYEALLATESDICRRYPECTPELPGKIHFIHSEELLRLYPDLTSKQRETKIAQQYGAVFIIGIGGNLSNGKPHDGRAPDYDDWSTMNEEGYFGLNGDIILWNPVLKSAFEISSMGIRVSKEALERQLEIRECTYKKKLLFHSLLLGNQLPLSIGGGIGQSRICMFFLKKMHIGEVQSSIWSEQAIIEAEKEGCHLL